MSDLRERITASIIEAVGGIEPDVLDIQIEVSLCIFHWIRKKRL